MIQARRNACALLVRRSNRKINVIRKGRNESKKHADMKEKICKTLEMQGHHFITEAIFDEKWGYGRADCIDLDTFTVYEIVCTEKEESLVNKANKYPEGLKIKIVRV